MLVRGTKGNKASTEMAEVSSAYPRRRFDQERRAPSRIARLSEFAAHFAEFVFETVTCHPGTSLGSELRTHETNRANATPR
jgi:hypothetical protein